MRVYNMYISYPSRLDDNCACHHAHTPRRGSESASSANQITAQNATATKQQNLPMVQQNQDPFCFFDQPIVRSK
jgi:hypothetical protein